MHDGFSEFSPPRRISCASRVFFSALFSNYIVQCLPQAQGQIVDDSLYLSVPPRTRNGGNEVRQNNEDMSTPATQATMRSHEDRF